MEGFQARGRLSGSRDGGGDRVEQPTPGSGWPTSLGPGFLFPSYISGITWPLTLIHSAATAGGQQARRGGGVGWGGRVPRRGGLQGRRKILNIKTLDTEAEGVVGELEGMGKLPSAKS